MLLLFALVVACGVRPAAAAIARDTSTSGATTGGSLTFSHTCTCASNGALVVFVRYGATTDDLTGVTYNGVALTKVDDVMGFGEREYTWLLLNPSTGANNVVVSSSASTNQIIADSVSYTGVRQSGQPDAHNVDVTDANTPVTSITETLTTTADNAWMVLFAVQDNNQTTTAGTGAFKVEGGIDGSDAIFDSNGAIHPAGSYSMTVTTSPAGHLVATFLTLAPAANPCQSRSLMGFGCH